MHWSLSSDSAVPVYLPSILKYRLRAVPEVPQMAIANADAEFSLQLTFRV